MTVRVRIAPSPTGDPHVGTAYISLFNYVFAKLHKGAFILRIEDTDQSRSRPEHETNIFDALKWTGLEWDEGPDIGGKYGPYRQSERLEIYKKHCDDLIVKGHAYKCFATAEELQEMREVAKAQGQKLGYDRRHRNLSLEEIKEREANGESFVIRLKVPLTGECVYEDAIKGRSTVPWADVDDQILMKSDGYPTYHLANIVDDHLMEITHVIRGDEWLSSMPKHILLYEVFGWEKPVFIHMPLLLGIDGKKLSKRKNPTSIFYYRDAGFLPEALLNFLSLMGYSMTDDSEIYPVEKLIKTFDMKRIGTSGAVFDTQKLKWLNQQYIINHIPESDLLARLKSWRLGDDFLEKITPLCHTRMKTFGEFMDLASFYFADTLNYTEELLCPKGMTPVQSTYILQGLIWSLDAKESWASDAFEKAARELSDKFGAHFKKKLIPLFFATVMGRKNGLPLFQSVDILGKNLFRARILQAIDFLGGISKKKLSNLQKAWDGEHLKDFFNEA